MRATIDVDLPWGDQSKTLPINSRRQAISLLVVKIGIEGGTANQESLRVSRLD